MPETPIANSPAIDDDLHERNDAAIQAAPPVRVSPWSRRQKLIRIAWMTFGRVLWMLLPGMRPSILRWFGATVGRGCRIAGSADILIPWTITMGDNVHIGEHVILYALGPLSIGNDVTIDCRAHLCAGSHDIEDPRFPQTRPGITIGDGSFIGIDAYISPGLTIGRSCIVHARASVYKDAADGTVLRGNPARPVDGDAS